MKTKYVAFTEMSGRSWVINAETQEAHLFGGSIDAEDHAQAAARRWSDNNGLAPDQFVNDWKEVFS